VVWLTLIIAIESHYHRLVSNDKPPRHALCELCVWLGRHRQSDKRVEQRAGVLIRTAQCAVDS
jgi:hypothetical protein